MSDAAKRLQALCSGREHLFWTDSVSVREDGRFNWNHVQGHRQLTDAYLLALAVENAGRIASFDSALSLRAVSAARAQHLALIPV